jgi:hypothetical protein
MSALYCSCFAQTRRQIPARNRAILQIREGRKDLDFEGEEMNRPSRANRISDRQRQRLADHESVSVRIYVDLMQRAGI